MSNNGKLSTALTAVIAVDETVARLNREMEAAEKKAPKLREEFVRLMFNRSKATGYVQIGDDVYRVAITARLDKSGDLLGGDVLEAFLGDDPKNRELSNFSETSLSFEKVEIVA